MATVEINDGDYILKVPERTVNAYLNRLNKLLAMPGGVRIAKAYLAAVKLCSPMVCPPKGMPHLPGISGEDERKLSKCGFWQNVMYMDEQNPDIHALLSKITIPFRRSKAVLEGYNSAPMLPMLLH